ILRCAAPRSLRGKAREVGTAPVAGAHLEKFYRLRVGRSLQKLEIQHTKKHDRFHSRASIVGLITEMFHAFEAGRDLCFRQFARAYEKFSEMASGIVTHKRVMYHNIRRG